MSIKKPPKQRCGTDAVIEAQIGGLAGSTKEGSWGAFSKRGSLQVWDLRMRIVFSRGNGLQRIDRQSKGDIGLAEVRWRKGASQTFLKLGRPGE